ncbi:MAG: zinc-ribbon domain-containing protein [Promethearchaeota archaeon]|jgi:putative Mn2+ efflux pump MntP
MVFCAKCGKENPDNSNVCFSCGAILGSFRTISQNIESDTLLFGFSRSMLPSLIAGVIIILIGLTYSLGQDFGQIAGGWAENFGETMGSWGENFGESMGSWGENFGRTFSDWGSRFGRFFSASILILIGLFIVANQLKRYPA